MDDIAKIAELSEKTKKLSPIIIKKQNCSFRAVFFNIIDGKL